MMIPFGGPLLELEVPELEPAAAWGMQPFGTPGARHSGAAFAFVERTGVISIAATTTDTAKAIDNNRRIASFSDRHRVQEQAAGDGMGPMFVQTLYGAIRCSPEAQ
jgi:hypothetical protein